MIKRPLFLAVTIFLIFSFGGCSNNQQNNSFAKSIFQTNGASGVRENKDYLIKLLLTYSDKLNKRNPSHYSKKYHTYIYNDIKNRKDNITLPLLKNKLKPTYKDYLNIAFNKKYVKNRNDYLILGIYKLLYWAYDMKRSYSVTTMQYDLKKIQKANEVMQIIRYRIRLAKDVDGNYLFITWQRAWQVDLLKKIKSKSLKQNDLTLQCYDTNLLLSSSNMSFEVINSQMIFLIQRTLISLGAEANNLSASAVKSVFIFL